MTKLGVNRFLQSIILTSACVLSATLGLSLRSDGANTAKIETVSSARQFDEKIIKRQERVNVGVIGIVRKRGHGSLMDNTIQKAEQLHYSPRQQNGSG